MADEAATLTSDNTGPMRIHLDFNSLYEEHAPMYTACFGYCEPGASVCDHWFKRGLPANQEPDGVETCARDGTPAELALNLREGCWGKCRAADVITAADRAKVEEVVTALTAEFSNYLAVKPTTELTFVVSEGEFVHALESRGYANARRSECARDCTLLSHVAVDEAYCSPGGPASGSDAVLSVTKPPGLKGIAGTGSSCASDQKKRPLWLVLEWHESIVGLAERSTAELIGRYRHFVIHEMLHGAGFANTMFNDARDADNRRKHLIEMRGVQDVDGETDTVWYFIRGRAYELAQHYFQCYANATAAASSREWDGLPLMGHPNAGRGAHWETRIMRDDVMSYGFQPHVSSITLAAMEDLGFYLANYSAAGCMYWGRHQGCEYVRTRCGRGTNDRSEVFPADSQSRSKCMGDGVWARRRDDIVSAKCERGLNPCATDAGSGFKPRVVLPGQPGAEPHASCDAQCYFTEESYPKNCTTKPAKAVVSAGDNVLDSLRGRLRAIEWQAWVVPLIWVLAVIAATLCVRRVVCPKGYPARRIAAILIGIIALVSLVLVVFAVLLYIDHETYAAFVGRTTIVVTGSAAAFLLCFSLAMAYALCTRRACILKAGFWLLLLIVLAELAGALLLCYWVYSLGAIPSDQLNSLLGAQTRESIDSALGDWLDQPLAVAEGTVCMVYQTCCLDPRLSFISLDSIDSTGDSGSGEAFSGDDGSGAFGPPVALNQTTCVSAAQHQGATTDLEITSRDPSAPLFCSYSSGASPSLLSAPPQATCNLVGELARPDGFSLDKCKRDFCADGIDGYLDFIGLFIQLLQRYALPLAAALATLVLLELILAFNLRHTATLYTKATQSRKASAVYYNNRPIYTEAV